MVSQGRIVAAYTLGWAVMAVVLAAAFALTTEPTYFWAAHFAIVVTIVHLFVLASRWYR